MSTGGANNTPNSMTTELTTDEVEDIYADLQSKQVDYEAKQILFGKLTQLQKAHHQNVLRQREVSEDFNVFGGTNVQAVGYLELIAQANLRANELQIQRAVEDSPAAAASTSSSRKPDLR